MKVVTCTAPVNIAVIKYWGKRDEKLILPINSSLSATLDQDQLCAKTTIATSSKFDKDRMWLNGVEQPINTPRLQNVLKEIRRRARKRRASDSNEQNELLNWGVHICSENNFPTAAGLASSAAGLACLVFTLAKLYGVEGDISEIARQGSGSACRSVYGGFVAWEKGKEEDGSDSIAVQVAPETFWPEMRVLILVVSAKKKHIGSTDGMQTSVKTSELLRHRADQLVPDMMDRMTAAVKARDFQAFAEITMKDSNQMHATCLDTFPPISYMTDTSRDIQRLVHAINKYYSENKVAYTYDAGPNACLYLLEKDVSLVFNLVKKFFPSASASEEFVRGPHIEESTIPQDLLDSVPLSPSPDSVQYVIHTKVGPGPQILPESESLVNKDGLPKKLK